MSRGVHSQSAAVGSHYMYIFRNELYLGTLYLVLVPAISEMTNVCDRDVVGRRPGCVVRCASFVASSLMRCCVAVLQCVALCHCGGDEVTYHIVVA